MTRPAALLYLALLAPLLSACEDCAAPSAPVLTQTDLKKATDAAYNKGFRAGRHYQAKLDAGHAVAAPPAAAPASAPAAAPAPVQAPAPAPLLTPLAPPPTPAN